MFKAKVLLVIYGKWVSSTGPNQYDPCSASQKHFFKFYRANPLRKTAILAHLYLASMTFTNISNVICMVIYWPDVLYIGLCMNFSHSWWIGSQNDNNSSTPLLISGILSSIWGDSPQLSFCISESECTPGFRETLCNDAIADQVALSQCEPVRKWKWATESCKMASGESVTEGEILRFMINNIIFSI